MKHRWLVSALLVTLMFVVLPGLICTVRLNFAGLALYHCDARRWPWDRASLWVAAETNSQVDLLQVRLCPMPGSEVGSVEILLRNLAGSQTDLLLHYKLSRLYRSLGLDVDADRELILARAGSASVLWSGLLEKIGLEE